MKFIFFITCLIFSSSLIQAQKLTRTVDSYTGDTTYSTGFDTLNLNNKTGIADRVVGVKTVHKKQSKYWLFFYFSTSDISSHPINISKKNFAYFLLPNNEYLRFPYTGKTSSYSGKDNAGFFIDITPYLSRLQFAKFTIIRFETSQLYHEIVLPSKNQNLISEIVNQLLE